MKFRFTPEMFSSRMTIDGDHTMSTSFAATCANWLLEAHLGTLPRVYGNPEAPKRLIIWNENLEYCTHSAILFDIEELPKKECEHEPLFIMDELRQAFVPFKCVKCGVRLKTKWEAEK